MKWPWPPLRWSRTGHTRGRLILLACVAAIPITAMAATIAWQDYQAIGRTSHERAALADGQALARLQAAIAVAASQLEAVAPRLQPPECDAGPALLTGGGEAAGFLTLSGGGSVLCRAGATPKMNPPFRWFERLRSGDPVATGSADPDHLPVIAIRTPDGTVAAAIFRPEWLAQSLPANLEPGGAIWLLDENRAVLASQGDAAAALPTLDTMFRLIQSSQFTLRAPSAENLRYAYATTLLPGGWRLIAATPAQREHELGLRVLAIRLAELSLLLALGLAAVVLGADVAFGNPLRRLSSAVQRWQGGAPFEPGNLTGAPDEVIELARSFKEATAVLSEKQAQLLRAQEEQNLLVLEIHHRVKNNLQVVASLLNLQASRIRVPEAKAEFQAARDRVRALATLHRHLYADGGLHSIKMRSFLVELCGQLFQAMGEKEGERIQLTIEAPELHMSSDQAVPLALIVTEAVTNSVKYAFPGGRPGHISVTLRHREGDEAGSLDLVISDDGVGIPAGQQETESGRRDGIGLHLIRGFARQLGATLSVEEGHGTRYAVRLAPQSAAVMANDRREPPPLDVAEADRDTAA